jgi:hypothetical protein
VRRFFAQTPRTWGVGEWGGSKLEHHVGRTTRTKGYRRNKTYGNDCRHNGWENNTTVHYARYTLHRKARFCHSDLKIWKHVEEASIHSRKCRRKKTLKKKTNLSSHTNKLSTVNLGCATTITGSVDIAEAPASRSLSCKSFWTVSAYVCRETSLLNVEKMGSSYEKLGGRAMPRCICRKRLYTPAS